LESEGEGYGAALGAGEGEGVAAFSAEVAEDEPEEGGARPGYEVAVAVRVEPLGDVLALGVVKCGEDPLGDGVGEDIGVLGHGAP